MRASIKTFFLRFYRPRLWEQRILAWQISEKSHAAKTSHAVQVKHDVYCKNWLPTILCAFGPFFPWREIMRYEIIRSPLLTNYISLPGPTDVVPDGSQLEAYRHHGYTMLLYQCCGNVWHRFTHWWVPTMCNCCKKPCARCLSPLLWTRSNVKHLVLWEWPFREENDLWMPHSNLQAIPVNSFFVNCYVFVHWAALCIPLYFIHDLILCASLAHVPAIPARSRRYDITSASCCFQLQKDRIFVRISAAGLTKFSVIERLGKLIRHYYILLQKNSKWKKNRNMPVSVQLRAGVGTSVKLSVGTKIQRYVVALQNWWTLLWSRKINWSDSWNYSTTELAC